MGNQKFFLLQEDFRRTEPDGYEPSQPLVMAFLFYDKAIARNGRTISYICDNAGKDYHISIPRRGRRCLLPYGMREPATQGWEDGRNFRKVHAIPRCSEGEKLFHGIACPIDIGSRDL